MIRAPLGGPWGSKAVDPGALWDSTQAVSTWDVLALWPRLGVLELWLLAVSRVFALWPVWGGSSALGKKSLLRVRGLSGWNPGQGLAPAEARTDDAQSGVLATWLLGSGTPRHGCDHCPAPHTPGNASVRGRQPHLRDDAGDQASEGGEQGHGVPGTGKAARSGGKIPFLSFPTCEIPQKSPLKFILHPGP